MAYLAPIHRPTGVKHAIKLNFLAPDEECLVVAKANRLEFYIHELGNLELQHTRAIYGKITMLAGLYNPNSPTDHLFIGTDRFMYFVVSWDAEIEQLRTEKTYVDQADQTARESMNHDQCLMDPLYQFMALQPYDGVVTILPITGKNGKNGLGVDGPLANPVPARVPHFFIRSSAFMHAPNKRAQEPSIAFLYEDNHQKSCLCERVMSYTVKDGGDSSSVNLDTVLLSRDDLELGASHLIPVPAPAYGLLVLADTSITYMNKSSKDVVRILDEAAIFVTWTRIDGQRWLLADEYGRLYFLMLILNHREAKTEIKLDMIGVTSRASVLVYLDNGFVFIGSHQGDCQVILIGDGAFEVIDTISSMAPILDLAIMDLGNRDGGGQANEYSTGQARIVTGSGAFQDGSLRSLRSGVIMEDLGLFEGLGIAMASVTKLFALRSLSSDPYDDLLMMSFIDETRIFQFGPGGEIEERDEHKSLELTEPTLLALNLPNERILQVCGHSARIIDLESEMIIFAWSPAVNEKITAASANRRYLAIAVEGIEVMIFDLDDELSLVATRTFDEQITCIHIPMFLVGICIAGLWNSKAIVLLKLGNLETVRESVVSNDLVSTPRSIILTHILPGSLATLLVAMANGEIVTFSVDVNDPSFRVSDKKVVVLGTQPATLNLLPEIDGLSSVFATCDQPSLIYGSEGRIIYAAVTAPKLSCLCSFDSEDFPGAIVATTDTDLGVVLVGRERSTRVQSLHVQETVRRIAYSPTLKVFGLGTVGRTLQNGGEVIQSHFKLVDEILFTELDTFLLNREELVESVITANLEDMDSKVERFVVGTAYLDEYNNESTRGRILLFAVNDEKKLRVTTWIDVLGACRALGVIQGRIVAGLVKTVVIYTLWQEALRKMASYRCATAPIDLAVEGDLIAVADIMKSVSIIKYTIGEDHTIDTLEEIARHYQTVWTTAVGYVTEDSVLEADAEGNLMVLARNTNGVTAADKRRLEITSEIRLGEMVNRIRKFNIPVTPDAIVVPKAFLGTVEGSIYLFATIPASNIDLLLGLQAALAPLVVSPGNVPFNAYRAFHSQVRSADEPFRFVDGELIDGFLGLGVEEKKAVVDMVLPGVEGGGGIVRDVVEGLRRLRG